MKSRLLGVLLALSVGPASAVQVILNPVAFGTAVDLNKDGVFDNINQTLEAASTGNNETFRGLLEFDLSAVSGTVTSAALHLRTGSIQYEGGALVEVDFHGYSGDGVIETSDALVDNLVAAVQTESPGVDLSIGVTSFLQTLPAYAGFMLRLTDETVDEAQAFVIDPPYIPSLVVNYSPVPIPPALYLFGSGLLGMIGTARKKQIDR